MVSPVTASGNSWRAPAALWCWLVLASTAASQEAPTTFTHPEGVVLDTASPFLTFKEQGGAARSWSLNSGGVFGFYLHDDTAGTTPFGILPGAPTNSLRMDSAGNLGLGLYAAASSLHVFRNDGSARITVEEASAAVAERQLFRLSNRGKTRFVIENAASGDIWTFDNGVPGFTISKAGTGLNEFLLDAAGNLTIRGQLSTGSDATTKTDLRPVDARDVLGRLLGLPLARWRYADGPSVQHLGPIAQDFHAAFGVGADASHIAPMDAGGVALAAIQGLHAELQAENERMREENRRLSERLAALEAAVARLASPRPAARE